MAQARCSTGTQAWNSCDHSRLSGTHGKRIFHPDFLTQYSLKSVLVLLCKSLKRTSGPVGVSTGKAKEISAGGHTGVSRGQVKTQEVPTHRRLTVGCGEKLRAGKEKVMRAPPRG